MKLAGTTVAVVQNIESVVDILGMKYIHTEEACTELVEVVQYTRGDTILTAHIEDNIVRTKMRGTNKNTRLVPIRYYSSPVQ